MAPSPVTGDPAGADIVQGGRPLSDGPRWPRIVATLCSLALVALVVVAVRDASHQTAAPTSQQRSLTSPIPTTRAPYVAVPAVRTNGVVFARGHGSVAHPQGLDVPRLGSGSSPTWSPDGSQVAVIDRGILVTDVDTGAQHRVPCPQCREIAWSPDGRVFAAAPAAGAQLGFVDATTGSLTPVHVARVGALLSLTWAPGSDELAFLANAGGGHSGVFTLRADGTGLSEIAGLGTRFPHGSLGATRAIQVRWSPTGRSLAVLTATPDPPSRPPPITLYRLRVLTMHADGTGLSAVAGDGRCACTGFMPSVAWSPDGTVLAVLAQHPRPPVVRLDGDGDLLRVLFVRGNGALSWQPR